MNYIKIPLNQPFSEVKEPTPLEKKLAAAKERTRQWSMGVNVDFPFYPIEETENPYRYYLNKGKEKKAKGENSVK